MKKNSYVLRLMLLAVLSASALVSLPSAGAQAGLEQTPIDIRNEDLTFVPNLPALGFSYETGSPLSVVNNGSPDEFATVRAELLPGNTSKLTVAEANGDVDYKLLQFHFHAPSEHELNGQKFPLEMHLVHQAGANGPISVVGVFIKQGKENKELKKFFRDLPAQPTEERSVAKFNLTRLLPESLESYRYDGSLTTPDPNGVFLEGIKW
ncbi:MAG TPA: carbonic anhydrase family protein, partial [Pyrinomonadaceae bacterium]